jgi:hypothetical protein
MQNNKSNIETIDEFDDCIQSLDIKQLRELESTGKFLFSTDLSSNTENSEDLYFMAKNGL